LNQRDAHSSPLTQLRSKAMKIINVSKVLNELENGTEDRITIKREDGKRFIVNVPEECWSDAEDITPFGLNLVFGKGGHYI